MLFDNIFKGAAAEALLAERAANYLHGFIPGEWSIRKYADPELFEGIPDTPQDPKIVTEESSVGLSIAQSFLAASFSNYQDFAGEQKASDQSPDTTSNVAFDTVTEASKHLHAEAKKPDTPERPDPGKPDVPTPPKPIKADS
jgi:hypothetical protein